MADDGQIKEQEHLPPKAGEPPLHRAARLGQDDEIRRLVRDGSDINGVFDLALCPDGFERLATPLMVSAGSGDGASVETVQVLLELGADAKLIVAGNSAAEFACEGLGWNYAPGGDAARLRVLLKAGSPIPENPKWANLLLCETAGTGDTERVKLLLERGLKAAGHWDPARAREEHLEMEARLAKSRAETPDLFASFPDDLRSKIEESRKKDDGEFFEQMCSAPSDYEIPLFRAAASGSAECVRALLAAGADPRRRDNSARTAMYKASSLEVIRVLEEAGLAIEDADTHGWTPLVEALGCGESGLPRVRALLAAGANVHAKWDHGYTVFMSAVGSGRTPEALRMLVAAGADPHAVSDFGFNAFHAAIDTNGESRWEDSVRSTFEYLDQLGVDLEQRTKGGQTPLAKAICRGTSTEVRILCEIGANPSAVCPLHQCNADSCQAENAALLFHALNMGTDKSQKALALLQAGADPLAKDAEGHTPLVRAVAELCREGDDYEGLFGRFFEGIYELWSQLAEAEPPLDREEFVASVHPRILGYVQEFAADIPIPKFSQFDGEWRDASIATIAWLSVYERWARIQNQRRSKPAPD